MIETINGKAYLKVGDKVYELGGGGGIDVASAKVGQTIKVKAVDENGKPTEWEPADFPESGAKSWNDLTDRPFGDESVTIEWDGDIEGKAFIQGNCPYIKISDLTPEPSELVGGSFNFLSLGTTTITEDMVQDQRVDGMPMVTVLYEGDPNVFVIYEPISEAGVTEAGIYVAYVSAERYIDTLSYGSIKKLDPKYLPDAVYGTSGTVTLTAANWTAGAYTLTVDDLGENDAIFFTPSAKADKTALEDASVFIGTEGQTVTLEAETTPTADITLDYFIVRGA